MGMVWEGLVVGSRVIFGGGFGGGKQSPQKKKSKSGNPAKRALEEGR